MSAPTFLKAETDANRREARLLGLAFALLTLAVGALFLAPPALGSDWSRLGERWHHLLLLPVWAFCAWLLRRFALRRLPRRDPYLLPVAMLLTGWGALTIWRLLPQFGWRQTGWLVVASLALIAVVRVGPDLGWLRRYRYLWLGAGILLTALTLIFGTHPSGSEPRLWLGCCGVFFQPSELLRLLLIVFVASYLSDRMARRWRQEDSPVLPILLPLLVVGIVSISLLFAQRDLGTGSLFLVLLAVMLYVATERRVVLVVGGGLLLAGGLAASLTLSVVQRRLAAWLNPWADPIGAGYQLIQSTMAIASGQVFGRGLGMGAPGFVPAAHTDFIFASIAEEWGLLGGLAMLALLAILVGRGLRVAAACADPFKLLLAAGLSLGLGLQSLLILGGVLRLLPLTGVALPFVSYGGSSLVTNFAGLGLLLRISAGEWGPNPYRPALRRAGAALLIAFGVIALGLGWWSLIRAPALDVRTDNPRRAREARLSPRGEILARDGKLLAQVAGAKGDYVRSYPEPAAAPVVGFDSARYGQAGIEAALDPHLRGYRGHSAWKIWWHRFADGSPPPGLDVRLTVDLTLQEKAMTALANYTGAAVLLEGTTGQLLALASSPSFDPAHLDEEWANLTAREDAPLLNRATQAAYQPGTSLAPLLYAWGYERDLEPAGPFGDPERTIAVAGGELTCALPANEGAAARLSAWRRGCPAPLAALADELEPASAQDFFAAFGLDAQPEIPLPQSDPWTGSVPQDADRLTAVLLGQGSLTITPVQLARAFASLGRGGVLPSLWVVAELEQPNGSWQVPARPRGDFRAVSPESARAAADTLGTGGRLEASGLALTGQRGLRLSYYQGSLPDRAGGPVVVIVLEDGSPALARDIGRGLLAAAADRLDQ